MLMLYGQLHKIPSLFFLLLFDWIPHKLIKYVKLPHKTGQAQNLVIKQM